MMGRPPDASPPAPGGAGKKCPQASPAPTHTSISTKSTRVDREGCSRTRPLKAKPCQVPDVTTTDTKSEQHNNGCSIPVGIAVARQRIQPYTPPLEGERVSYLAAGSQTCLSMCQQQLTPQQQLCQPLPSWAPLQHHWHHPQPAFQDGCAAVPPIGSPQYFLLPSGLVAETRSAVVWGGGQLQGLQVVAPQPLLVGSLDRHRLPRHEHPSVTGMMVDVGKGSERTGGEVVMVGGQEHQQVLVSSQLVEQHQQGFVLSGAPPPPALVPVHTQDTFHQLPHLVISHTQTNSFLRSDLNTTTVFPVNSNIVIKEESCSDQKVASKCMNEKEESDECEGGDGRGKVADASNQTDSPPAAPPSSPPTATDSLPEPAASIGTTADTKPLLPIKIEAVDVTEAPTEKKATDWVRDARLVCQADQHQAIVDVKPVIPPVQPDLSGLELLSNSIIQLENREPEIERLKTPEKRPLTPQPVLTTPPTPPPSTLPRPPTPEDPMMGGLGLLCQAADLFEESVRMTSVSPARLSPPPSPTIITENRMKTSVRVPQITPAKVKKLSPLMRPVASPPTSPPPESPRKRPGRPPKRPLTNGNDLLSLSGPPILEVSASSPQPPSPSTSPPILSPCKRKHPSSSDEQDKRDDRVKKRKVGRPRKRDGTPDSTETLVSNIRPSKAIDILLGAAHDNQDRPQQHKIRPKLKAEAKIKSYKDDDDDIQLGEVEEVPKKLSKKPSISVPAVIPPRPESLPRLKPVLPPRTTPSKEILQRPTPKIAAVPVPASPAKPTPSPKVTPILPVKITPSPIKVEKVVESIVEKVIIPEPTPKETPPVVQTSAKQSPRPSSPKPGSPAPKPTPAKQAITPKQQTPVLKAEPEPSLPKMSAPIVKGAPSCRLSEEVLSSVNMPIRVLYSENGLFYPGTLSEITAPDLYSVTLDNERSRHPHILAREQIITDTMVEVKLDRYRLEAGTRLCALWSQQYNCLYPGVAAEVAAADDEHVIVEFDDGDRGSITRNHLRLLPPDFPLVMCDKNPLHGIGPRKRQSSTSVDSHSRHNSEPPVLSKSGSAPKGKEEEKENENRTDEKKKKQESSKVIPPEERRKLKKKKKMELRKLLDDNIWQKLQTYKRTRKELMKHRHKHKHKHKKHKHRRDKSSDGSASGSVDFEEKFEVKDAAVLPPVVWDHDPDQSTDSTNNTEVDPSEQSSSGDPVPDEVGEDTQDTIDDQKDIEDDEEKEDEEKEDEVKDDDDEKEDDEKEDEEKEDEEKEDEEKEDVEKIEDKVSGRKGPKKVKEKERRRSSTESKSAMGHFIESQQFWEWTGKGVKRKRKTHYNSMHRNDETINVGDCAVFLSTSHPDRPYIGRIEALWETPWASKVRVRWFYHPQETTSPPPTLVLPGGLFESDHIDENDVQTVSHKCRVMELPEYRDLVLVEPSLVAQAPLESRDTYYVAGFYDAIHRELNLVPGAAGPVPRRRN